MTAGSWRFLDDPPARGSWNMAVDDALLASCAAGGPGFPCVRFYRWDPPALSLGYHQDAAQAADRAALQSMQVDLVRRPTGGRAVLHEEELTYSVVAPCREGALSGPVMQSYRRISEALIEGLARLGLAAALAAGERSTRRTSLDPCFARSARCEVESGGAKVVGSVQLQRRGALLQHGSIPFRLDASRLARATGGGRAQAAVGLWTAGGPRVGVAELTAALAAGFETRFGTVLAPGALSPEELAAARELERRRYGDPAWTLDRPGPRGAGIS